MAWVVMVVVLAAALFDAALSSCLGGALKGDASVAVCTVGT